MEYLVHWGHLYIVHFGAWISFMIAATVYKKGVPEDSVGSLLLRSIALSAFLAIFSSHSHHYMTSIIPDTKILHEDKGK